MDALIDWLHLVALWLVDAVHHIGYLGLFLITFAEAVPVPAELIVIPAGYLVQQGEMKFVPVILATVLGTTLGASFNYWLARTYGRSLFLRFGKYLMLNPAKLDKLERFFTSHGPISIFLARLTPGIRHYAFIPAGLAKMKFDKFAIYTVAGALCWNTVLVVLGYHIGANQALAMKYLPRVKGALVLFILLAVTVYVWWHGRRKKLQAE